MRTLPSIALFLLLLCTPAGALAGTFVVPFGGGTPMLAAGWTPRPDAGSVCAYEGTGTVFLNAGTLAAHSGCLYLFNAPAAAQILAVNVALSYAKASAATALCAYSFGALPGDTLRHCTGGAFANAIAASGANWVELGLYNEGATPIGIATARANNVIFTSGWVTLSDPTAPGLAANGPTGIQTGLSAVLNWAASDPESGAPSVAYSIDGGGPVGLRGQACSWLCGTDAGGSTAIDLGALADGPHSVTVYAQSYADAGASVGPIAFIVDRTPPAQATVRVEPDAAASATGWWGHGPVELTISSPTAGDVTARACSSTDRPARSSSWPASRAPSRMRACPPRPSRFRAPTRSRCSSATAADTARPRRARDCTGTRRCLRRRSTASPCRSVRSQGGTART